MVVQKYVKKAEKLLGSAKFAVFIILLLAIGSTIGTFQESYHGRQYATQVVYKSWWFILIQVLMFLSILVATLVRLPPKKRLYGFYTVHAGLITLFIGSFITYIAGVDAMMELLPNKPTNKIQLEENQLVIRKSTGMGRKIDLPNSAAPEMINFEYEDLLVKKYLPSAKIENQWEKIPNKQDYALSGEYFLYNENISQNIILSLHPASDFNSTQRLGLLSLHYLPENLSTCFKQSNRSGYIIWDTSDNSCYTPEDKSIPVKKTKTGSSFIGIKHLEANYKFFPDFSPLPVNDDLSTIPESNIRVFSKKLFQEKPNLFIFGNKVSYYSKRKKAWLVRGFSEKPLTLPWMGFKLQKLKVTKSDFPVQIPVYTKPIQESGKIIEGDIQAVEVAFYGKSYWVRSDAPLALSNGKTQMQFQILQKEELLPYEIGLDRFKMDTNPGTNDPASYESFVSLLDGRNNQGSSSHHVYMNNPLKYDGFTFYQSSYFEVAPGEYGSAFSVNYDPGRAIKYAGSLLIVLGCIWHFFIRRKNLKLEGKQ